MTPPPTPANPSSPDPTHATSLTQDQMAAYLADGKASALLPGGLPGPVYLADRWWVVPADSQRYQRVGGEFAERLTAHAARLAAATAAAHPARPGPATTSPIDWDP